MKHFPTPWWATALALNLAHAAPPTESASLRCPATIAQSALADDLPQGWVVHGASGELRLLSAAFYEGDPVGLGSLAPESTHRNGQTEISIWRFGPGDSARAWIGCHYRDATTVVARPLPPGLHQCTTILQLTTLGDPAGPLSVLCL